jgi:hypothetical protein
MKYTHIDTKLTELPVIQVEIIEPELIIIDRPEWLDCDPETVAALELADTIHYFQHQAI